MFDFSTLLVSGIPLVVVIFGLIEFIKSLGAGGKLLTIISMLLGVVFGFAYQLSLAMPTGFAGWFGVAVFGLGLGLVASGFYKFIDSRLPVKPTP